MPNWKIPPHIRTRIQDNALELARRPLELALRDFPLTTAELQYHCAALTREQAETLRRLDAEGVRTIEHHRQLRLAFIRENLPELRRGVVLMLMLPEWIVVGKGTQWGIQTTEFKSDENHYIVPNARELDPTSRIDLVTWINRALRQVRLYEITKYMVEQALERERTPTSSHLHAFWPILTTMLDGPVWRERFRNPTRSLKAYQPDADVKNKYAPLIRAAETMITAGRVLPETPGPNRTLVQATIEHWERIPGDPTFPLAD